MPIFYTCKVYGLYFLLLRCHLKRRIMWVIKHKQRYWILSFFNTEGLLNLQIDLRPLTICAATFSQNLQINMLLESVT